MAEDWIGILAPLIFSFGTLRKLLDLSDLSFSYLKDGINNIHVFAGLSAQLGEIICVNTLCKF